MAILAIMRDYNKPTPVYFVLYKELLATSLALPLEMLHAANDLYLAHHRVKQLDIRLLGETMEPVTTHTGVSFTPQMAVDQMSDTDWETNSVIYLPGLWRNPDRSISHHQALVDWLSSMVSRGSIVCAAGTGSWYLAATGALDNKPTTTHWHYFEAFQKRFPACRLMRQHMITQAGKLYCAGSVNALADLTVHLISQLFDQPTSAHVERHFSHEARRPFEHISFLDETPNRHQDEDIIQVQLWLNQNFNKRIELIDLAGNFDMSLRNFNRRFKAATGKTPLRYLQEIRVANARELLKSSNLSIGEVAHGVGYQDPAHFTALFKSFTQMTPSAFRKSVRSKLFSL